MFVLCKRKILLVQEEDLRLAQEEDKEGLPEKLKMVKKQFFPELSGDLWGVICYHHWYPRAGLEIQKIIFIKTKFDIRNDAEFPLSMFHLSVRPESFPGAGLSTFGKSYFCYVQAFWPKYA